MFGVNLAGIVERLLLGGMDPGTVVKTFDSKTLVGMQGEIWKFKDLAMVLRYDRAFSDAPYLVSGSFGTGREAYIEINGVLRPFFGDKLPIILFFGDLREAGQDHILSIAASSKEYVSILLKGDY